MPGSAIRREGQCRTRRLRRRDHSRPLRFTPLGQLSRISLCSNDVVATNRLAKVRDYREARLTKSKSAKPPRAPTTSWPSEPDTIHLVDDWIWIPLKAEWRDSIGKPEELVRQKFIRHLCENCGYSLEQMRQEQRMISGSRSARADIVIWETPEKAAAGPGVSPVLVIECKSESVEINLRDYYQGESYTRSAGCEFFVATNNRFTAIFKLVPGAPGDFVQINELPKGRQAEMDRHRNRREDGRQAEA